MRYLTLSIVILFCLMIAACDSRPKVIESEPTVSDNTSVMDNATAGLSADAQEHKVVVKEALNTQRYTYLNVTEDANNFWIAIPKKDVKVGGTYYYKGGLLKRNFQSQEFNRVFETVYLVSDVSDQPLNASGSAIDEALSPSQGAPSSVPGPTSVVPAKGAITIAELTGHLGKYEGKLVKITGKCVKVNPMIMGRNWVHLQDGTANNYDLTITTGENIDLGSVVTLEGTIALKKDFGAGYKYDVIMEGAVVK